MSSRIVFRPVNSNEMLRGHFVDIFDEATMKNK